MKKALLLAALFLLALPIIAMAQPQLITAVEAPPNTWRSASGSQDGISELYIKVDATADDGNIRFFVYEDNNLIYSQRGPTNGWVSIAEYTADEMHNYTIFLYGGVFGAEGYLGYR